jgi:cbb3-type cytochrome oxidase subunit 3
MPDTNDSRRSETPLAKVRFVVGQIVLFVFGIPFVAAGIFMLFHARKKDNAALLAIVSLIFCAFGLWTMFGAATAGRKKKQAEAKLLKQTAGGEKPWLVRADWAAGKIKSSTTAAAKFLWLWSILALALSAPAVWHIPQEWQKGNHAILIALIFPVVAFYLIGCNIVQWRSRRRFGDTFFELAQIPAPLGGSLDGMIQTGARLKPEHGLHLKLSCIRRTVSGAGNNRSVQESILWQDEKVFAPDASLPEQEPGHSGIPVFFKLPADQPECHARGNEAVLWRLEARAKMSGPDFRATFEVPVFQVAGVSATEAATDEPDPTGALQMPVEELRRDEHSRIQLNDVPGGREFYFPAARNPGTAFFTTLFMLVFNGAAVFMYRAHKPMLFPIVFGVIGVLLILGAFNLWFKSSRVTINSTNVQLTKRWLIFSRQRDFSAGDCARFATKTGMQSGSTIFTDIKLVRIGADAEFAEKMKRFEGGPQVNQLVAGRFRQAAGPSGVTVASSIANAAEAGWLVKEMNKALGRVA